MVVQRGIQLPYLDTGWALLAAVAYSTTIGAIIIPMGIIINVIMIGIKFTDTLILDLWNFWHWAFIGSMVYYTTGSYIYGIIAAIAIELFLLWIGDVTAPQFQKFFKLPGITIPHVINPVVAVATLTNPIKFNIMGDSDNQVKVSMVFMLALNKKEDQVVMLKELAALIQNTDVIDKMRRATSSNEILSIINHGRPVPESLKFSRPVFWEQNILNN